VLRGLTRLAIVPQPSLDNLAQLIDQALARYSPQELGSKARADAAARAARVFRGAPPVMPSPVSDLAPVTLSHIRAGRASHARTLSPTRHVTQARPAQRRDRGGALTTAAILGQDDLVQMSPGLATAMLADAVTSARSPQPGAAQIARVIAWLLLTGEPPQRALETQPQGLSVDDYAAATDWLATSCSTRGIRWQPRLNDLSAAGRAGLQRASCTPDEIAVLSGIRPPKFTVALNHYLHIEFSSPEAQTRVSRHFDELERSINRVLSQQGQQPLSLDRVIARTAYLDWAAARRTDVSQPAPSHLLELGEALSRARASAWNRPEPAARDHAERAIALYVCLAVLGLRPNEEIPFVKPAWFDAIRQRLVMPVTKAYAEGRAIPYTLSLQRQFEPLVRARRRLAPRGCLFAAPESSSVRPKPSELNQDMVALARNYGYAGQAYDVKLYRHAALSALHELGRGRRLGWVIKSCVEGHGTWLQSETCDLSWQQTVELFEPFWCERLKAVGIGRAQSKESCA
jgi:hypothetical protein